MAGLRSDGNAVSRSAALILLAAGASLFYGWELVPKALHWDVWSIARSVVTLGLLAAFLWRRSGVILAVGAWWACEELLTIGCSTWHLVAPFKRLPGGRLCDGILGFDTGALGIAVVAALALWIVVRK